MAQTNPETKENARHHFLFHIFKWDQKDNPMPANRAEVLIQKLRSVFAEKERTNRER